MPYVATIQTLLQAPKNLNQVANQINRSLSTRANVNVGIPPQQLKQLAQASNSLVNIARNTKTARSEFELLGKAAASTFQRFAGFTVIISTIYSFVGAVKRGIDEAIDFEKQLTRIRQVTGESSSATSRLGNEIFRLSAGLGVSSKELAQSAQILAQAGFSADEVRKALEGIALSDLSPTFDNINDTTEGLIATFQQFNKTTDDTIKILETIDIVSAKYAVESSDLVSAIRRTGGAFAAAGGNLEELAALFTSVRATTRESADSIAVAFRTIFARLQRPRTISFLDQLGIDISDNGQFKGPLEVIRSLNEGLSELSAQDVRFAQVIEEIGGIRQISKVIPLIQQFPTALQALFDIQLSQGRLAREATVGQESLANALAKVREEFQKTITAFVTTDAFRQTTKGILDITKALISVIGPLKEIAPLLAFVGAGLVARTAGPFTRGFLGGLGVQRGPRDSLFGGGVRSNAAIGGLGSLGGLTVLSGLSNTFGLLDNESRKLVDSFGRVSAEFLAFSTFIGFGTQRGIGRLESQRGIIDRQVAANIPKFIRGEAALPRLLARQRGQESVVQARGAAVRQAEKEILSRFGTGVKGIGLSLSPGDQERKNIILAQFKKLDERLGIGVGATRERTRLSNELKEIERFAVLNPQETKSRANAIAARNTALGAFRGQRLSGAGIVDPDELAAIRKRGLELRREEGLSRIKLKGIQDEIKNQTANNAQLKNILDKRRQQVRAIERQISLIESVNVATAFLAAALDVWGSRVRQSAEAQLRLGGSSGVGGFRVGSGLQTAGQFAVGGANIGGLAGSFFGPAGTAIGAGVGGATGGIAGFAFGFLNAAKEAKRILDEVTFENGTTELTRRLQETISGRAIPAFQSGFVQNQTAFLRQSLSSADVRDKAGRIGGIENVLGDLKQFLDTVARASSSLQEFTSIVGKDTLQFFSDFSGIALSETIKNFGDLINASQKQVAITERLNAATLRSFQRAEELNSFVTVLAESNRALRVFNSNLSDIGDFGLGGSGTTSLINRGEVFRNLTSIINTGAFAQLVRQTLSPFGGRGKQLGAEAVQAGQLGAQLPRILLRVASANPFGGAGDVISNLRNELEGFPSFLRESIIAQAESIVGDSQEGQKLLEAITTNLAETSQRLLGGEIENIGNILSQLNSELFDFTNDLIQLSSRRREVENRLTDLSLGRLDLEEQRGQFLTEFRGRPPSLSAARAFDFARQQTVLGGDSGLAGNVGGIGAQLFASQRNIIELQNKLQTAELSTRGELINALDEERLRAERLTRALGFLADASSRNAALQAELARLTSAREARRGLALDFIFGGADDRSRISRGISAAGTLARTGDIEGLGATGREAAKEILGRLGPEGSIGGIRVKDLEDILLRRAGFGEVTVPSEEEERLARAVSVGFETAIAAQNTLIESGNTARDELLRGILTENIKFTALIDNFFTQNQRTSLTGAISQTEASISGLLGQQGALNRISQITGLDTGRVSSLRNDIGVLSEISRNRRSVAGQQSPTNVISQLTPSLLTDINQIGSGLAPQRVALLEQFLGKRVGFGVNGGERQALLGEVTNRFGSDFANNFNTQIDKTLSPLTNGEFDTVDVINLLKDQLGQLEQKRLATGEFERSNISRISHNLGISESQVSQIINNIPVIEGLFEKLPKNLGNINIEINQLQDTLNRLNTELLSIDKGKSAINTLNRSVDNLAGVLSTVPSEVNLTASHKVEVIFNGSEVFNRLQPSFQELAVSTVRHEINKMLRTKFPDVGAI